MRRQLVQTYVSLSAVFLYIISPHFAEKNALAGAKEAI
jgi:hypothetical protein